MKKNRVIRFSDEEWKVVKKRASEAQVKSVSTYIRNCAIYGEIKVYSFKDINSIRSLISTIGNNVNQIAMVANSTQSVFQKDITDVQAEINALRDYVTEYIDSLNYDLIE